MTNLAVFGGGSVVVSAIVLCVAALTGLTWWLDFKNDDAKKDDAKKDCENADMGAKVRILFGESCVALTKNMGSKRESCCKTGNTPLLNLRLCREPSPRPVAAIVSQAQLNNEI